MSNEVTLPRNDHHIQQYNHTTKDLLMIVQVNFRPFWYSGYRFPKN